MLDAVRLRLDALDRMLNDGRPRSDIELASINRQVADLKTGHERGLVWCEAEARRAVEFCGLLAHWKGEFHGKSFIPEPWQEHCLIAPMFGWLRKDGTRRFRRSYISLPRKAGKTSLCATFALHGLIADCEQGAEVYAAATKLDQAAILFKDVCRMTQASPVLGPMLEVMAHSVQHHPTNSTFKALSSDAHSLDGLNISRAIIDELHKHKTRDLWDVLVTATGARKQPLIVAITTAGSDRSTICYEVNEYTKNVNAGHFVDDSWFGFISCADIEDDPFDPETWRKANPNLGVSIKTEYMAEEATKAKESRSYENSFRRLLLNQWTETSVRWIPMRSWDACKVAYTPESLHGQRCFAGLDLASTADVNAFSLYFPESKSVLPFFWVPEDSASDAVERDRRQVMNWASNGYIKTTDGNVTDYETICFDIGQIAKRFDIAGLAFDPWGPAPALVQALQRDGLPYDIFTEFRQGFQSFAMPSKEFERLVIGGMLRHNGNPVLRWMAANAAAAIDPAGNIKPDKAKSADKIDGIVALIMALGLSMRYGDSGRSVYETSGSMLL